MTNLVPLVSETSEGFIKGKAKAETEKPATGMRSSFPHSDVQGRLRCPRIAKASEAVESDIALEQEWKAAFVWGYLERIWLTVWIRTNFS